MGETKQALLAVSFGTSHLDTLEKNIAAIEGELAAAFPARTVRRAFTSGMILRKLARRDGLVIDDVPAALEKLAAEGYADVLMQPTHVINGEEYDKLRAQAAPFGGRFARLRFGAPLLTRAEDYQRCADALFAGLPLAREN
ncbi:MAG: sirohydrochlorin cobaltochelatase, partial [Oscillospiraceae bacterium]|nr:sirohydrochlorin cobaltochelatase [Oscillospiraceae bacterium]